jgi:hypothetical protein
MTPSVSLSSLKDGRWYEYLVRFALGGFATVLTGVISATCGASIGGVFLALPAIFCASATLIEKHETRRKRDAGLRGSRRGQQAAALDATGAALGSIGMAAFAASFAFLVSRSVTAAFAGACAAWGLGALGAWGIWLWSRQRAKRLHARARVPDRERKARSVR